MTPFPRIDARQVKAAVSTALKLGARIRIAGGAIEIFPADENDAPPKQPKELDFGGPDADNEDQAA